MPNYRSYPGGATKDQALQYGRLLEKAWADKADAVEKAEILCSLANAKATTLHGVKALIYGARVIDEEWDDLAVEFGDHLLENPLAEILSGAESALDEIIGAP